MKLPNSREFHNPVLRAIRSLGGSASIHEIEKTVTEYLDYPEEIKNELQQPYKAGKRSVLGYKLAWARTYLKFYGMLDNSSLGVWALTAEGQRTETVDPDIVVKEFRKHKKDKKKKKDLALLKDDEPAEDDEGEEEEWRTQLYKFLVEEMSPDGFERLTQRFLREMGFLEVEVTGRSGDGGIDGKGIARVHDILTFPFIFQCKKYKGSVSSKHIREFRGAMSGRDVRGLFVTTGTFTASAREEASRDGVPPIDLIDGEELLSKLLQLELGVKKVVVEQIKIDTDWFKNL